MKAIGYFDPHPLHPLDSIASSGEPQLELLELPRPQLRPGDLLVDVRAVSVNPVDTKVRRSRAGVRPDQPVVLGWDAAGVVVEVGSEAHGFAVGDRVFYAGDITRAGSDAELQAIDHRIVARMPESLDFAAAAALPLTSITAWEALFEKLRVPRGEASDVLVVGGAGGVGAIAVQLLRRFTPARVHATAGRPESRAFLTELGVTSIVDRHGPLGADDSYDFVFATTGTADHWAKYPKILRPFGALCLIDDAGALDVSPFKLKSLSVCWELMFTKSRFGWKPETQGEILRLVARSVDEGLLRSTATTRLEGFSVASFVEAHRVLESGTAVGKIVVVREVAP
ncbi:MAG: zinc-binding alcohol dehydrogenase family protein [Myxococcota bacterium]